MIQKQETIMPKDEYAQQPSAPDLGAVLDETPEYIMVGADAGDLLDAGYVPPDRPYVLNDDQVTARGMWEGETLDQRLAQELPDATLPSDAESDRAGRLAADDYAPGSGAPPPATTSATNGAQALVALEYRDGHRS